MVLKLYGVPLSPSVIRVGIVLHEKNIRFELVMVDLGKGEHKTPEFKAKNPFEQIPYIDDGGFILFDSRAIIRYLEEKYPNQGAKLIPQELEKRALFEQAAAVEMANFNAYAQPLVFEAVWKPMIGQKTDENKVEEMKAKLAVNLDAYEQILSKQKYLAGDELTLADLQHLPYGSMLARAGCNAIEERPNVARWFNDLASRPSWEAVKGGVTSST
ncbi:hypothetical protein AGABI1DRAFT_116167, partial [Agaricus bisporus var. burnettii JB137-S8]|uniref:glutathione transferase n=2 Tax=Agaricus bisporus var. burnettii TaxID=192524 RepID=A0A8H7EX74_AGABI